jgi:hypothetical protein
LTGTQRDQPVSPKTFREIDAEALLPAIDRSAPDRTTRELHQTFLAHGCAIVRGAVDPMRLAKTKAVIDEAYREKPGLHVHDADLLEVSGGFWSGWEMVDTPLLQHFLRAVFASQEWRREFVTARRIQGFEASSQDWQKPLELYLDSQFHALPSRSQLPRSPDRADDAA